MRRCCKTESGPHNRTCRHFKEPTEHYERTAGIGNEFQRRQFSGFNFDRKEFLDSFPEEMLPAFLITAARIGKKLSRNFEKRVFSKIQINPSNERQHIGLDMGKNHGQQIDRRRVDSDIMVQAERPPQPPEIATMEEPNRQS